MRRVIALKFSVGTVLVIMGLIFLGVGAVIMTVGIIMFFDIFALIGMSVTVYAAQNDRKKYYVDIDSLINRYNYDASVHDYR